MSQRQRSYPDPKPFVEMLRSESEAVRSMAESRLINMELNHIKYCAHRICNRKRNPDNYNDLVSYGMLLTLELLRKYNHSLGTPIHGYLSQYLYLGMLSHWKRSLHQPHTDNASDVFDTLDVNDFQDCSGADEDYAALCSVLSKLDPQDAWLVKARFGIDSEPMDRETLFKYIRDLDLPLPRNRTNLAVYWSALLSLIRSMLNDERS